MPNSSENLINDLKPDQKIYRVFRLDRFFELVHKQELVLVKPKKWNDPFENFLSRTIIEISQTESISFIQTNKFYGQCWTTNRECDGMWRNYASLNDGVVVQTTAGKLISELDNPHEKFAAISYFLGRVDYMSDSSIKDLLSDGRFVGWLADTSGKNVAKTLLIKREEFSYEKEVRLLFSDYERKYRKKDTISFKIDAQDLFTEIIFAPQIYLYRYMAYKEFLKRMGFNEKIIKRSKLYDPYKLRIKQR